MSTMRVTNEDLSQLRNANVSQILRFLGEVPPYLEAAIKRQFTSFALSVEKDFLLAEPAHTGEESNADDETNYNR